ncbi:MAG TPA: hypothetical protein VH165_37500 [Kofleriaceae bacterium]|jgi:hypothetical protein|nr:hypothetical protein [Kofleriaceae bacterium]
MTARKAPESWFWSHDIQANQITSVVMPGTRLVRLSSYGKGPARRFAALVFQEPGPARSYALDLDAAALAAKLAETGARAVGITVDALDDGPRFSVVLETGPGPLSSVHVDLDDAGVRALLDGHHTIADLATYVAAGVRKYAVIVEEHEAPAWFLTGLTAHELDAKLLALGAQLTRVRSYTAPGGVRALAAVAEKTREPRWAWYAELDGDGVARNLETNEAYPFDLDATRDDRGTRFTVVMYRQPAA